MHEIIPIPALNDNYIWLIHHRPSQTVAIVDPGEAAPVIQVLEANHFKLSAILITHHHWDHTNGIHALRKQHDARLYAPAHDPVSPRDVVLEDNDEFELSALAATFKVLFIPGHTKGHIAYSGLNSVFCGDTLFTGGCGKLFEGTASQMLNSLKKLAHLPDDTRVYCGHEYTQANLKFAHTVEPNNPALQQRIKDTQAQRAKHLPTVPSTIAIEKATNPFLRCDQPQVKHAIEQHFNQSFKSEVEYFSALRAWKDRFKT